MAFCCYKLNELEPQTYVLAIGTSAAMRCPSLTVTCLLFVPHTIIHTQSMKVGVIPLYLHFESQLSSEFANRFCPRPVLLTLNDKGTVSTFGEQNPRDFNPQGWSDAEGRMFVKTYVRNSLSVEVGEGEGVVRALRWAKFKPPVTPTAGGSGEPGGG